MSDLEDKEKDELEKLMIEKRRLENLYFRRIVILAAMGNTLIAAMLSSLIFQSFLIRGLISVFVFLATVTSFSLVRAIKD